MDYPKSVPNVGLVDGHFVDENPATGQVGSLIPAAWGDAITREILNVITAGGLVPSESNVTQLLQAILTIAASDNKRSVRVATTGPIALSGLQTIDGVQLVAGDRVLVKNQANAAQNWIFVAAAGAWQRAQDADDSIECIPGHFVPVQAGTANALTVWQLTNTTPPVLGTTPLNFALSQGKTGVTAGTYRQVTVDALGRVMAGLNPTTLAGYGITNAYTATEVDTALGYKANLQSPLFTGTPRADTAALGTNTSQLATCAFVLATVNAVIGAAPGALDTLVELAAALGNDPNFATTITNALAAKAPLLSPVLTGNPTAPTPSLADRTDRVATTQFVGQVLADLVADPWAMQPIGVPIPVFAGAAEPPRDKGYRYIKLTYGDAYNTGVLTGEVMTGVAPLVVSYGRVALAGSPINGNTVYLLNTERRYIRPGGAGALQNDAVQNITAVLSGQISTATAVTPSGAFSGTAPSWSAGVNVEGRGIENLTFDASRVARTDNETRTKNIGANLYMRIK